MSRRRKKRAGPLTSRQQQAVLEARKSGLYLLVEPGGGPGTLRSAERWRFYDRETGREVLVYLPGTGVYLAGDVRESCKDDRQAIALAAGRIRVLEDA